MGATWACPAGRLHSWRRRSRRSRQIRPAWRPTSASGASTLASQPPTVRCRKLPHPSLIDLFISIRTSRLAGGGINAEHHGLLLGSGKSSKGQDLGSLDLQLVCRRTLPHLAGRACRNILRLAYVQTKKCQSLFSMNRCWCRQYISTTLMQITYIPCCMVVYFLDFFRLFVIPVHNP